MEDFINQSFGRHKDLAEQVAAGHYDLVGPYDEIIRPQDWEDTIEPGMQVTIKLWPIVKPTLDAPVTDAHTGIGLTIRPPHRRKVPSVASDSDSGQQKMEHVNFLRESRSDYLFYRLAKRGYDWSEYVMNPILAPVDEIERKAKKGRGGDGPILDQVNNMSWLRREMLEEVVRKANDRETGDARWEVVYIKSWKVRTKKNKIEVPEMDVILARSEERSKERYGRQNLPRADDTVNSQVTVESPNHEQSSTRTTVDATHLDKANSSQPFIAPVEDDKPEEILLLDQSVARLIKGQLGGRMRKLERESGAHVQILKSNNSPDNGLRSCKITGSRAARQAIKDEISSITHDRRRDR